MQIAAQTTFADSAGRIWPTREQATAKQLLLFEEAAGALIDTIPIVLAPKHKIDLLEWLTRNRNQVCGVITQLYPEFCDDDS